MPAFAGMTACGLSRGWDDLGPRLGMIVVMAVIVMAGVA
jgi:hypothetical protein